jgi:hypothetical protein
VTNFFPLLFSFETRNRHRKRKSVMSRPAIVAAFIAGVALAATIVVLASPQQPAQPSLSEKLAQLSHFAAADRHAKHFTQGLDAKCSSVPSGSDAGPDGCGGEPGDYLFQDGCC